MKAWTAIAAALLASGVAVAQTKPDTQAEMEARGVRTVQDAIAALDARGGANGDDHATTPRENPARFFGPDAYPPEAIQAHQQGRTVAALSVAADGRVTDCAVATSSGSAALDRRTCEIALASVAFNPAKDRRGRRIASTYMLPVRWVLPESVPVPPLDAAHVADLEEDVTLEFAVDAEGKMTSCRTIGRLPAGEADACGRFTVGQSISAPWQRDGRAVGATIRVHTVRTITVDP